MLINATNLDRKSGGSPHQSSVFFLPHSPSTLCHLDRSEVERSALRPAPPNLPQKTAKGGAEKPLPYPLNPVQLKTNPPRNLHIPRTRPLRTLQPGNRSKPLFIHQLIRHIKVPMVERISRLRSKLKL